jgi:uncharacterized membrane protein YfhO
LLCSWTDIFNPSFLISAVLVVASVVFIGLYIKDNIKRSLFQIVAIFLILVDLFIITAVRLRFVPAKDVAPTFGVTEFLKREKGLFRIFRLQDIRDPMEPMDAASFLRPNTHLFYGLSSIEGWKSLMPSRYIEFIRVFEKGTQRQLDGLTAEFQDFDPRILNLMNVTYIITSTKRNLRGLNFELVCEGDGYRVFKNLNALPRAFIFYKHKVVTDKAEILATIGSPSFELDKEIILEEPLPLIVSDTKDASSANKDKVEIVNYQPHLVDIATETQKGGYLFLSDSYDAGWKAYLDGKYVKIYKADYIFRAVPLPKGRHKVLFLYKPASLKAGFLFTAIGFIISIAIMAKDMPHKK